MKELSENEFLSAIGYFRERFPDLKEPDIVRVISVSRLVGYSRNELLMRAGTLRQEIWFVVSGLVRAYYIKENGQEMTPFFWAENQITASWEALYLNRPSSLNYEAVEPAIVLTLDFPEFRKLVRQYPDIQRYYVEMLEQILTESLVHSQEVRNEKPEDRYIHFLREHRDLAPRISQKLMASFLGITPISLSRLKKRLGVSAQRP